MCVRGVCVAVLLVVNLRWFRRRVWAGGCGGRASRTHTHGFCFQVKNDVYALRYFSKFLYKLAIIVFMISLIRLLYFSFLLCF